MLSVRYANIQNQKENMTFLKFYAGRWGWAVSDN